MTENNPAVTGFVEADEDLPEATVAAPLGEAVIKDPADDNRILTEDGTVVLSWNPTTLEVTEDNRFLLTSEQIVEIDAYLSDDLKSANQPAPSAEDVASIVRGLRGEDDVHREAIDRKHLTLQAARALELLSAELGRYKANIAPEVLNEANLIRPGEGELVEPVPTEADLVDPYVEPVDHGGSEDR